MAAHIRTQIREAITELLKGLPTTADRVFKSRLLPLEEHELPAIKVNTNKERIETQGVDEDPQLSRALSIDLILVAKLDENLDDVLDASIKEVEQRINESVENNTLNGLVLQFNLEEIDIKMADETSLPTGEAVLTFIVTYYTRASAPDLSI